MNLTVRLSAAVVVFLWAASASAQLAEEHCPTTNVPERGKMNEAAGYVSYYVDFELDSEKSFCSGDTADDQELLIPLIAELTSAAEVWNNETPVAPLVYGGAYEQKSDAEICEQFKDQGQVVLVRYEDGCDQGMEDYHSQTVATDTECASVPGECEQGICQVDSCGNKGACQEKSDCARGMDCIESVCQPLTCESDDDCEPVTRTAAASVRPVSYDECPNVSYLTLYGNACRSIPDSSPSVEHCQDYEGWESENFSWLAGSRIPVPPAPPSGGTPVSINRKNLRPVLVHEFGHVLGIGHSDRTLAFAPGETTMCGPDGVPGCTGYGNRNLFPWEKQCAEKLSGLRGLPRVYTLDPPSGYIDDLGPYAYMNKGHHSGSYSVVDDENVSYPIEFLSGFQLLLWREYSNTNGVINTGFVPNDYSNYSASTSDTRWVASSHLHHRGNNALIRLEQPNVGREIPAVVFAESEDMFQSLSSNAWLQNCSNGNCELVESHVPVAVSPLPGAATQIVAYADGRDRLSNGPVHSSTIRLGILRDSPQMIDVSWSQNALLYPGVSLEPGSTIWSETLLTDFAPGIACKHGEGFDLRCLVAFVSSSAPGEIFATVVKIRYDVGGWEYDGHEVYDGHSFVRLSVPSDFFPIRSVGNVSVGLDEDGDFLVAAKNMTGWSVNYWQLDGTSPLVHSERTAGELVYLSPLHVIDSPWISWGHGLIPTVNFTGMDLNLGNEFE